MSERSEGFWQRVKRVHERIGSIGGWRLGRLVVPILAFGAVWYGAQDLGPAWAAAHGRGQYGVLLVQEVDCNRSCSVYGEFISDDGTVRLHHALLDEPPRGLLEGDRTRVVYPGGRPPPTVFRENGSWEWLLIGGLLLGGIVALGGWGLALYARLTHRFVWEP